MALSTSALHCRCMPKQSPKIGAVRVICLLLGGLRAISAFGAGAFGRRRRPANFASTRQAFCATGRGGGGRRHMTRVTLRVLDGADRGQVFEDLEPPVTIGREEGQLRSTQRRTDQPLPSQDPGGPEQAGPDRPGKHQRHSRQRRRHATAHPALWRRDFAGPLGAAVRHARSDRRPAGGAARATASPTPAS